MTTNPVLFRKRLIPDECVLLKDDEILCFSSKEQILITKWHALKPKKDLHHGYSAYFWKEGFKVSKFYRENGELMYWYCDIIDVTYPYKATDSDIDTPPAFLSTDLLADVIIYPDGFVKVVDLDELNIALDKGILDMVTLRKSLKSLSNLLELIYSGKFKEYQAYLEKYEI